MNRAATLKQRMSASEPVLAPLVLNPLMAKQAEAAGFEAVYLGGGAMGYAKVALEANLSLTEMSQAGLEIGSVTELPIVLDGACGWGDPMHMHRTIPIAETAGFAAIEIEDQLLPKRAHHHVGIEHMIPSELMAAKVRESVAARRNEHFLVIARTNAIRVSGMDDALRRLEAYKTAGADALLALVHTPEDARYVAERLPGPFVLLSPAGGPSGLGMSTSELGALGYKLICDPQTVLLAMYEAANRAYEELSRSHTITPPAGQTWGEVQSAVHDTIGLEKLLRVERDTVERPG